MYSRRFTEHPDLPPDYGGVALRREPLREKTEDGTFFEGMGGSLTDTDPSRSDEGPVFQAQKEHVRKKEQARGYDRTLCRPRRPLYCRTKGKEGHHFPQGEGKGSNEGSRGEQRGQKGLLSSLFSLSGKSFTMEDVILAGLILLLLGEREKGERIDGELLFALTFLLLGGR